MTKLTLIEEAVPSDQFQFGGQTLNQFILLFSGTSLDNEENIRIDTSFKFYSGKFALVEEDPTHAIKIIFKVENIDTGGDKTITYRNPTVTNDFAVTEKQLQVLENKVLGTNTQVSAPLDFNGNAIVESVIDGDLNTFQDIPDTALKQITDKNKLPVTVTYEDEANTYADLDQKFRSGRIKIRNPANTFEFSLVAAAILANRIVTLPPITSDGNVVMDNFSNIFTATQTIRVDNAIPVTVDRPNGTIGVSNAINYQMRNNATPTPEVVTYGQQNTVLLDNVKGSEDAEYRVLVMSNGVLTQVMGLIQGLYKLGSSTKQVIFDSTLLTTGRTYQPPNQNGVLQLQDNMTRVGAYVPSQEAGMGDGNGLLRGMVGIGIKNSTPGYSTAGKYDIWSTRTVVNDLAGVVKLDSFVCARLSNPLIRFIWRLIVSPTRRMFKGLTAKRLINDNTDTTPLNSNESGFMIGYGAGDTQFYLFHNDATGACLKTPTGINLPGIDSNMIADIQLIDSPASVVVTLWTATIGGAKSTLFGGPVTQLTRIPGQVTQLYIQDLIGTSDGSTQGNNINKVEVYA